MEDDDDGFGGWVWTLPVGVDARTGDGQWGGDGCGCRSVVTGEEAVAGVEGAGLGAVSSSSVPSTEAGVDGDEFG